MADISAPRGARLFCILARDARTAVIFRRGPSRWVQLIKWDTRKDQFEHGQWFHGRVYERRCDLSPKGDKLIYFAAKYRKTLENEHESWTAISRPPWFTALALWPHQMGAWHGGGLFDDEKRVLLNHRPLGAVLDPKFRVKGLTVRANPNACGEDDPLYSMRLERDGWNLIQDGKFSKYNNRGWEAEKPQVWEKPHGKKSYALRMILLGIHSIPNDDWYILEFEVNDSVTKNVIRLGRASWAD